MTTRARILDWAVPVTVLAILTVVLRRTGVDMALQERLYVAGVGWPLGAKQPWDILYHYGVVPAWVVALSALAYWIASAWRPSLAARRRVAALLVLSMVVGPGLIVNSVFKQRWGRPRPRDVVELGGDRAFLPVWTRGEPGRGNSFSSGHAATGFYLFVPWLVVRHRNRARALAWLATGLVYGALVGFARMAQGAHFLSDVVWSAGFVYLSALAIYYALRLDRSRPTGTGAP